MKMVCSLKYEEAVEAIKGTKTVMYKHGVWNKYTECSTEEAIKHIRNSGYGADVRYDDEKKMFFVSVPADCDNCGRSIMPV